MIARERLDRLRSSKRASLVSVPTARAG